MGPDTLLVALGEEDEPRIDAFARAVIDVAGPSGATVVIAHVLSEETYRDALEEAGEETRSFLERRFDEGVPVQPGIEGDVPEWVMRRSRSESADRPDVIDGVLDRKNLIQNLAVALADAGIAYEIRGDVGDPAEGVVAMAEEVDADFVIVGGRKRSSARRALFGSVSRKILESVRCPVISVRDGVYERE
jgi:nucleotide-binding universal stress UspA family protein